jgi:hypothetical protein
MKYQIPIFAGLLGIGVVLGATFGGSDDTTSIAGTTTTAITTESNAIQQLNSINDSFIEVTDFTEVKEALQSLQLQLQQEITKRKELEQKVAMLEKNTDNRSSSELEQSSHTDNSANEFTNNPHQSGSFGQSANWFNEQAMLDAGIDSVKVTYIKSAFEQAEMDKLYLRDQATREGWLNSERYTDAAKEIANRTSALREQLTEQEYDAYLYAAGRSNRVIVESVLSTSPASNAGMQPGDTILRYGNKRIYNWSDLTTATSDGTPNDTVSVTIERNGQTQQVYVPRGPLGIRLATDSVAP